MPVEVLILSCVTYAKSFWVAEYYKDMPSLGHQYVFSSRKVGRESLAITVNDQLDYFYGFNKEDLRKSYSGGFLYPPVGKQVADITPEFPTGYELKHYYEVSSYAITKDGPLAIDPYWHNQCVDHVGDFWSVPAESLRLVSFPEGVTLSQSL